MKKDVSLLVYLHSLKLNLSHVEMMKIIRDDGYEEVQGMENHKLVRDIESGGYIYDKTLTDKALDLFNILDNWVPMDLVNVRRKAKEDYKPDDRFMEWLGYFPKGTAFKHGGKLFSGTRNLHVKIKECEKVYVSILEKGEVTHQQLVDCLALEVKMRKADSVRLNQNELRYMKSTLPWLNGKAWENTLPLLNEGGVDDGDVVKLNKNYF